MKLVENIKFKGISVLGLKARVVSKDIVLLFLSSSLWQIVNEERSVYPVYVVNTIFRVSDNMGYSLPLIRMGNDNVVFLEDFFLGVRRKFNSLEGSSNC